MEHFFDSIVKHNCQKIFATFCRRLSWVETFAKIRNPPYFPRRFLPRKASAGAPTVRLSSLRTTKNATLSDCVFFKVAGWTSGRIGLRCACPIGFLRGKNPVRLPPFHATKNATLSDCVFFKMAGWTRLELATSCVTGRRSNQLNYHPLNFEMPFRHIGALLSIRFLKFFIFALPVFARLGRVSRRSGILYSTSARQKT